MVAIQSYYDQYCRVQSAQLELLTRRPILALLLLLVILSANALAVSFPDVYVVGFSLDAVVLFVLAAYVDVKQKIYEVASPQRGFMILVCYVVGGALLTRIVWPLAVSQIGLVPLTVLTVFYWHTFFVIFNLSLGRRKLLGYLLRSTTALLLILGLLFIFSMVLLTNSLAFTTTNDRFYQRIFWQLGLIGCFVLLVPLYEMQKVADPTRSSRGVQE